MQRWLNLKQQLAGTFDPNQDNGDYVPCFFTATQLMALRPLPPTPRLTGEQAENLVSKVMSAVLSAASSKVFGDVERAEIIKELNATDFEGLTPSQALAQVIAILQRAESLVGIFVKLATDSTGGKIGPELAAELIEAAVSNAREAALRKLGTSPGPHKRGRIGRRNGCLQELFDKARFRKYDRPTSCCNPVVE